MLVFARCQSRHHTVSVMLLWFVECFRHHVRNVVPWMSVQSLLEPLLVKVVTNEAHAAAEHKQCIEGAYLYVLLGLLSAMEDIN